MAALNAAEHLVTVRKHRRGAYSAVGTYRRHWRLDAHRWRVRCLEPHDERVELAVFRDDPPPVLLQTLLKRLFGLDNRLHFQASEARSQMFTQLLQRT